MAKKKKRPARSKKTGKFVSARYAKRYPHLVKGWPVPQKAKVLAAAKPARRRRAPAPDILGRGVELELTATTRGGTPRRDKQGGRRVDPSVLAVKVYGQIVRPMPFAEAARLLHRAVQTGVWNRYDIDVELIDWSKGRRVGRYRQSDTSDALVNFRHALRTAAIRVAVVDQ